MELSARSRSRGRSRDSRPGPSPNDGGGPSLRRLRRAINRRRHLCTVRRARRPRGPSPTRAARGAGDARRASPPRRPTKSQGRQRPIEIRIGINTGEVVVRTVQTARATPSTRPSVIRPILQRGCRPWRRSDRSRQARRRGGCARDISLPRPGPDGGQRHQRSGHRIRGDWPGAAADAGFQLSAQRGFTKFVGREHEMAAMRRVFEQASGRSWSDVAAIERGGHRQVAHGARVQDELPAEDVKCSKPIRCRMARRRRGSRCWNYLKTTSTSRTADDAATRRREDCRRKSSRSDSALNETLPYLYSAARGGGTGRGDPAQMNPQVRRRRMLDALRRIVIRESLNHPR